MVLLGRPYHFKFFKDCLPQILLGPFLKTLTHIVFLMLNGVHTSNPVESLNPSDITTVRWSTSFSKET